MFNEEILSDITVGIKTFMRFDYLARLLVSIDKYYPKIKIIIVDDSPTSSWKKIKELGLTNNDIRYIKIDQYIGLSAGRNILVKETKTEYFILCDDDFIFHKGTDIAQARSFLSTYFLDICAGNIIDIHDSLENKDRVFHGIMKKYNNVLYCYTDIKRGDSQKIPLFDFVLNFFIARTSSLKCILWNENLFILEHLEFFYRVKKNNLRVSKTKNFSILHDNRTISQDYNKYRIARIKKASKKLKRALGVKKIYLNGKISQG